MKKGTYILLKQVYHFMIFFIGIVIMSPVLYSCIDHKELQTIEKLVFIIIIYCCAHMISKYFYLLEAE